MLIYLVTNQINQKKYVGQTTKTIEERWRVHLKDSKRKKCNYPLYNAIRKYGANNFTIKQLGWAQNLKQLNRFEIVAIAQLKTLLPNGYNVDLGGKNQGPRHETTKAKISAKAKGNTRWLGKHHTEETKQKLSLAATGREVTDETRAKISATSKGRPGFWTGKTLSPEHKQKIGEAGKGRTHVVSDEAKQKMSVAKKGKKLSPEHCANISTAQIGSKRTAETKQKMSVARKAWWATRKAADPSF